MNTLDYEELRKNVDLMTIVIWHDQYIGFLMDIAQFTDFDYKVLAEQLDNGSYKAHGQQLDELERLEGLNNKITNLKANYVLDHGTNLDELEILINFMSER